MVVGVVIDNSPVETLPTSLPDGERSTDPAVARCCTCDGEEVAGVDTTVAAGELVAVVGAVATAEVGEVEVEDDADVVDVAAAIVGTGAVGTGGNVTVGATAPLVVVASRAAFFVREAADVPPESPHAAPTTASKPSDINQKRFIVPPTR